MPILRGRLAVEGRQADSAGWLRRRLVADGFREPREDASGTLGAFHGH
jgi:hypothetical protein